MRMATYRAPRIGITLFEFEDRDKRGKHHFS